ncbi:MAG: GNAT family N-acetyltransferase [Alphaproteobacteria bacterium]|nr:GNAT family N-acetyltransferase [Alphaproteobacteria bacterium]
MTARTLAATIAIDEATRFVKGELAELCEAAEAAIRAGGGFGWLAPPPRQVMESYWKGVLLVPERRLFLGRLDGVVAASAQLLRPSRQNEIQAHAATLTTHFVAPWARGHGLARELVVTVCAAARAEGFRLLNLDVRETQTAAIAHYESLGFVHWGTHPLYAMVDGAPVVGRYYYKRLDQ